MLNSWHLYIIFETDTQEIQSTNSFPQFIAVISFKKLIINYLNYGL